MIFCSPSFIGRLLVAATARKSLAFLHQSQISSRRSSAKVSRLPSSVAAALSDVAPPLADWTSSLPLASLKVSPSFIDRGKQFQNSLRINGEVKVHLRSSLVHLEGNNV